MVKKVFTIFSLFLFGLGAFSQVPVVNPTDGEVYLQYETGTATVIRSLDGGKTTVFPLNGSPVIYTGQDQPCIADLIAGGMGVDYGECTGNGLSFDGFTQYAYVADNGALDVNQASTDFCLSGFAKLDNLTSSGYLFGKGGVSGLDGRFGYYQSTGTIQFIAESSGGAVTVNDNITAAADTWYHVAAHIDISGSKIYFYINGELQNAGGSAFTGTFGTLANAYELVIGAGNASGGGSFTYYSESQVKDVRIYHKDVTSKLADLQAGKGLGGEVAWWCLSTLTDLSGNGYDLTGVNLAGYDIDAFSDYASTIDGSTKVETSEDITSMIPQGSELSPNPNLDADIYAKDAGWTYDGTDDEYDCDGTNDADLIDGITFTAEFYHVVRLTTTSYSSGDVKVRIGGGDYVTCGFTGNATKDIVVKAGAADANIDIRSISYSGSLSVISVKELEVLGSDLVTGGDFTLGADLNVSNCVNSDYTTFVNATPTGFDAVSDGSASHEAGTADELTIVSGQKYIVTFDFALNSGTVPRLDLYTEFGGAPITNEGYQYTVSGANVFEFTANQTTTGVVMFYNISTATNYSITNLSVKDADTDWTKQTGWIISGGTANCDGTQTGFPYIRQTGLSISTGDVCLIKFTISDYSAGTIYTRISIENPSSNFSANGTYTCLCVAGSSFTDRYYLIANSDFIGSIDNVSVHKLEHTVDISNSTNYDGENYIIPIDENDFAIPVDYTAEAIDGQIFNSAIIE